MLPPATPARVRTTPRRNGSPPPCTFPCRCRAGRTVTRALRGDSDAGAAAVTAGRVLSAAGPLTLNVLIAAVARSPRFRRDPPHPDTLAAALTALRLAAPDPDRTWHATAAA